LPGHLKEPLAWILNTEDKGMKGRTSSSILKLKTLISRDEDRI